MADTPTAEQMHILANRAEAGLTPGEAARLRAGIAAFEQAQRTLGGVQAENRRLRRQIADLTAGAQQVAS